MSDLSITPAKLVDPLLVLDYWTMLSEVFPFLEYRFCNIKKPTVSDAMTHTYKNPYSTFFVMRPDKDFKFRIVGEYTLEFFNTLYPRPRVALIHFSFSPYEKETVRIVEHAHDVIFSTSIRSLIGLTPVDNKPAQVMLKRFGYKRLTVLPNAAYHYGEPVDGVLSVRKYGE